MKNSQVKLDEPPVKTAVLPKMETKTINQKFEPEKIEEKKEDQPEIEKQEQVINKRILKKFSIFWKLGIKNLIPSVLISFKLEN